MERKERVQKTFNELRADNLHILDNFYHSNLNFEDPVGSLSGLSNMKAYYKSMYQNVTDIRFDFHSLIEEEDDMVGIWTMELRAKGLNSGKPVFVKGSSHLRFDPKSNLVIKHRDYFDMGEMIYEHIPLLGKLIKAIKGKFSHD